MKLVVSLWLLYVFNVCVGSPVGLSDVDEDLVGYEDFLKDIVMAAEPRRSRREPVEELVGKTLYDVLSDRTTDENLGRVRRDEGNQMLIMGSPYARGSSDCDTGMRPKEPEGPLEYYDEYPPPPTEYYQNGPYQVPIPTPYQLPLPYSQMPAVQYQQPSPPNEQYEPYVTRTGIVPKVFDGKTSGIGNIGIPIADGGGSVTHSGNLGGLGLPGLGGLGGLSGLGGLGATGLSGLAPVGHGHVHGHKGVGSIAVPVGHEPAYITSIPFISGYEMKPIYSMKKVVVKEIGKDHGLIGHKGLGLSGLPGLPGLPGLASRSSDGGPSQGYNLIDQNPNYQVFALPSSPSLNELSSRSNEDTSPPHHLYVANPGDHQPLDLNIFFVDPVQGKEASEPDLMSPEAYSDAIRTLQQRMDHLQSLKLAQELRSQPEEINCI